MEQTRTILSSKKSILLRILLFSIIIFSKDPASLVHASIFDPDFTDTGFEENNIQYEEYEDGTIKDTDQDLIYEYHSKTDSYSLKRAETKTTSVTIPDTIQGKKVTKLSNYAFYDSKITKAVIGKYVDRIGQGCFYNCKKLETVKILGRLKKVPTYCFYNCKSLRSISLPSSVTTVKNFAFGNCKSLYQVRLPASIKKLGEYSFYECNKRKLTYITPKYSYVYKKFTQKGEPMLTSSKATAFTIHTGMMVTGEKKQISALNYNGNLKWKSSNSSVLKISASGSAKALKPGSATLTADGDSKRFTFRIQVLPRTKSNVMKVITSEYVRPEMTDFEKVCAAHAYLIRNVKYDYQNYLKNTIPDACYTANGALVNGIAVCQGYALAMKTIMKHYKIPCVYVTNSNHGWNAVQIDGKWFHVDCTFDDPIINGSNSNTEVYTKHLLIPDHKLPHSGYTFHCNTENAKVNMKSRTTSATTSTKTVSFSSKNTKIASISRSGMSKALIFEESILDVC